MSARCPHAWIAAFPLVVRPPRRHRTAWQQSYAERCIRARRGSRAHV